MHPMYPPNEQTEVGFYSGEGEERVDQGGQTSQAALAPSVFYPNDKTQTEPYNEIQSGPSPGSTHSGSSSSTATTSLSQGPSGLVARRRRSGRERERENNTLRMRGQRHLLKEQKEKIRRLLLCHKGCALPNNELQLWTQTADHMEQLRAENAKLKREAGKIASTPILPNNLVEDDLETMTVHPPICSATTSQAQSQGMTQLYWEEPASSNSGSDMTGMAGPSSLITSPSAVTTAPAHLIWDPAMVNYGEDYLAMWNARLGQHTHTGVHRTKIPNHEVGVTGAEVQTYGSTEGLGTSSAGSGMQDHLFAYAQQSDYQEGRAFK